MLIIIVAFQRGISKLLNYRIFYKCSMIRINISLPCVYKYNCRAKTKIIKKSIGLLIISILQIDDFEPETFRS